MSLLKQPFLLFSSCLFLVLIGLLSNCSGEPQGTDESFKPSRKTDFSHVVHEKIDCKHCHNPKNEGETEGIPTATICMKCHKQPDGNQPAQSTQK